VIKEIFLPEKIAGRRLLSQRIAGINIQNDIVYVTVVYAKSSISVIEKFITVPIEAGDEESRIERAARAVQHAMLQAKHVDYVRVSLPSSMIVYKEVELPFVEADKIRMVLDYEIEGMLPFAIDQAVVDFIITKKEASNSQVLVAAMRKVDLKEHLQIFEQAEIDPSAMTIDLFALYSMFQLIPEYNTLDDGCALVDFGQNITRISFLMDGQLRLTRHIQRGVSTIVRVVANELNISPEYVQQKLTTFGVKPTGDSQFDQALKEQMINFFNDIQFTLNSFSLKLNYYKGVKKILFSGSGIDLNGIVKFTSDTLQIPCEIFDPKKILANKLIKSKAKGNFTQWHHFTVALGSALSSQMVEHFNLRRKEFSVDRSSLIKKQLISSVVIIVLTVMIVGLAGYQQMSTLSSASAELEQREVGKLVSLFSRKNRPKSRKLRPVLARAKKLLKQKKDLWSSFAKERLRPLEVMLELTTIMDKKLFNLDIEEMEIKQARDTGELVVSIDGYFSSKLGAGHHFQEFEELQERFEKSPVLVPSESISPRSAAERGIQFSINLKRKPKEE